MAACNEEQMIGNGQSSAYVSVVAILFRPELFSLGNSFVLAIGFLGTFMGLCS